MTAGASGVGWEGENVEKGQGKQSVFYSEEVDLNLN